MSFEILKAPAARKVLAVSHGRFFELRKRELVPVAVQISARSVGYPSDELLAVARARVAGWTDEQIAQLVKRMAAKRHSIAQEAAEQAGAGGLELPHTAVISGDSGATGKGVNHA
jgi:predicted DNA-binding transcriptional regulator AlpA